MSDTIIDVENLSKRYRLRHAKKLPYTTLRDTLTARAKHLFTPDVNPRADDASSEDFWALKDVSFQIARGDVVGIIGRNGAGKSTLLKILSRITEPTSGRITLRGRVASLLEVGTGFHAELSGRENIFLNGAILGMSKPEIRSKFDEIVAFSEVEKFLDTPVKHYSSGMYVRLAFAVAAHLDPEILIVDEVLAVGDAQFQKKCLGKISDVARGGRTVLFVSHNMLAVQGLCNQAILFSSGTLVRRGQTPDVLRTYIESGHQQLGTSWVRPDSMPQPAVAITSIQVTLDGTQPHHTLHCSVTLQSSSATTPLLVAVDISDAGHSTIMQALPHPEPFIPSQSKRLSLAITLPALIPGVYTLDFWIGSHFACTMDWVKEAVAFEIVDSPTVGRTFPHSIEHGRIVPPSQCTYSDN